jgi:hypothetical protein
MPNTTINEKLDALTKAVIVGNKFTAIDLINAIRTDAERMEQNLFYEKARG